MPRYKIQAPDGRTVTIEGDAPPSEADLDGIFAQLPAADAAPEVEGPGIGESVGRGAIQGLTFGFGDEITGAIEGGYRALTSDAEFGDAYTQARDESRAANEAAREENPWAYGLAEVGSGALTGGLGAARAVGARGATSLASRLGRGAAAGGSVGAGAGVGYSEAETPGEVLDDAVTAGGVGSVLGAASPAVGRVLQRAMHRLNPRQTARRDVAKMFEGEEANVERALRSNPELRVGDMGSMTRKMMVDVADEDTLAMLEARGAGTAERLAGRARDIAGPTRMNMQSKAGTQIEHSYAKLPKPRTNMKALRAEFVPDDDPQMRRIWTTAERQAARRYGTQSKKYPMAVLHNAQRAMRSNNDSSIRALGREMTDELEDLNPQFRAGQELYREGSEIQKAYEGLNKGLRSKSAKSYINKVLDESNPEGVEAREAVTMMLGGPESARKFFASATAEREMLETLSNAQKQALEEAGPWLAKRGKSISDAVKALWIANAADSALGVQQKLATATAARNLLTRLFELNPGVGVLTRSHRRKYEDEMRKLLVGRQLPQYQAATARAITPTEAGAGGVAAVMPQLETF